MGTAEVTTIAHAIRDLTPWLAAGDGGALVVLDEGIVGTPVDSEVKRAVQRSGVSAERHVINHQSTLPGVLGIADRIPPGVSVVAVGGGGLVDQVKLGALVAGDRRLERVLRGPHRCGLVALPLGTRRDRRFATVLTTVGTGSHVSPNACLASDGGKRLFNSPALRPDLSIVDPVATASLPSWMLLEGVLENLARLAGVYVGGSDDVRYPSDGEAEGIARALVAVGYRIRSAELDGQRPAAGLRAELACLSGRTHAKGLAAGREPYIDKSWPLSHELSAALGLRKMQAMASVLVPMWHRIEDGHTGFGSDVRLGRFWSQSALVVRPRLASRPSAGLASLMEDWQIDADAPARARQRGTASTTAEARRIADRAWHSWGRCLPMLRGLSNNEIYDLYADCLATRGDRPGVPPSRVIDLGTTAPAVDRLPVTTSSSGRR